MYTYKRENENCEVNKKKKMKRVSKFINYVINILSYGQRYQYIEVAEDCKSVFVCLLAEEIGWSHKDKVTRLARHTRINGRKVKVEKHHPIFKRNQNV